MAQKNIESSTRCGCLISMLGEITKLTTLYSHERKCIQILSGSISSITFFVTLTSTYGMSSFLHICNQDRAVIFGFRRVSFTMVLAKNFKNLKKKIAFMCGCWGNQYLL